MASRFLVSQRIIRTLHSSDSLLVVPARAFASECDAKQRGTRQGLLVEARGTRRGSLTEARRSHFFNLSTSLHHFSPTFPVRCLSSTVSEVQNGQESEKPSPSAVSMDAFLEGIYARGKLRADRAAMRRAKEQPEMERRQERTRNRRLSISETLLDTQSRNQSTASRNNSSQHRQSRNQGPGKSVKKLLNPESVFMEFKQHDAAGTAPSSEDIIIGAACLANAGNVEGVRLCQKLLSEHDEETFNEEMKLNVRLGTSLWLAKEYEESMKVFKETFRDYPSKRRLITNAFRFCVNAAVAEFPSPEQLFFLYDFAKTSSEMRPLAHIWQALFRHEIPAANEEAFHLLTEFPQLGEFLVGKLDSLLRKGREERKTNLLFRMLPLFSMLPLAEKDLRHLTGCIYDALMLIYCEAEDVKGAQGVLRMAKEQTKDGRPDFMWPETVKRLVDLTGVRKVEVTTVGGGVSGVGVSGGSVPGGGVPGKPPAAPPVAPKLRF